MASAIFHPLHSMIADTGSGTGSTRVSDILEPFLNDSDGRKNEKGLAEGSWSYFGKPLIR